MVPAAPFRTLKVWRDSMDLVEVVYALTRRFPSDERFGLSAQLRRAAVSIPSNIGEGARRKRHKVKVHFWEIALGSQSELDVQLEIAQRLAFCSAEDYSKVRARLDEVGRMLSGLIASVKRDETAGSR